MKKKILIGAWVVAVIVGIICLCVFFYELVYSLTQFEDEFCVHGVVVECYFHACDLVYEFAYLFSADF